MARRGEQHHLQPQNQQLSPSLCRGAERQFEVEEAADIADRVFQQGRNARLSQLLGTGVLIIPALKRLLSKSKQNDPEQLKEYLKLHQKAELELNSLRLVVAHIERLSELISNIRGKQQRPSQKKRKAKARSEQKLKAEEVSALQRQGKESVISFALCP